MNINNPNDIIKRHIHQWLQNNPLEPLWVDCSTSVMLKILDGKCKMDETEKFYMSELYQQVYLEPSVYLGAEIHALINQALIDKAQGLMNEAKRLEIYEKRVLAETTISRPVMKHFKAYLRNHHFFNPVN